MKEGRGRRGGGEEGEEGIGMGREGPVLYAVHIHDIYAGNDSSRYGWDPPQLLPRRRLANQSSTALLLLVVSSYLSSNNKKEEEVEEEQGLWFSVGPLVGLFPCGVRQLHHFHVTPPP
ncbi:hypothetical protein ACE6H2_003479 [Prunus campanulata]